MEIFDHPGTGTIHTGDHVWVAVGSGNALRPGIVDSITKKSVKVTFRWANGHETIGRRFEIAERRFHEGVPTPCKPFAWGVHAVNPNEVSSWTVAWIMSAPKSADAS